MELIFAQEATPEKINKSVFLVGPTPRNAETQSWRPRMIQHLRDYGFKGTVFTPEPRDGSWHGNYLDQTGWERRHLEMSSEMIQSKPSGG